MQQEEWIQQFNHDFQVLIGDYVQKQDFHALETPLKTGQQLKSELREKLIKQNKFENLSHGIFNAVDLINEYLETNGTKEQREKIHAELVSAFKILKETSGETPSDKMTKLDPDQSLWTALYGISDETLLLIYDIVLKCYQNNEIENAKDLLGFLLIFAPILPAYWNALGFCYQTEGNFEQALDYFLIAEELDPELLQTHFYLARCYHVMNQKPAAHVQMEKIVTLLGSTDDSDGHWRNQMELLVDELN